jgi:hypothetical protein
MALNIIRQPRPAAFDYHRTTNLSLVLERWDGTTVRYLRVPDGVDTISGIRGLIEPIVNLPIGAPTISEHVMTVCVGAHGQPDIHLGDEGMIFRLSHRYLHNTAGTRIFTFVQRSEFRRVRLEPRDRRWLTASLSVKVKGWTGAVNLSNPEYLIPAGHLSITFM